MVVLSNKIFNIYSYTVCSGIFGCSYVCRRVCNPVCQWVWQWISDRFGRDVDVPMIAPEDSDDLTDEEREYIEETNNAVNLCNNCICSIGRLVEYDVY